MSGPRVTFLGNNTPWMFGSTPPWAIVTPASSLLSSSSFRTASWMWRGIMRVFLLSRDALPASSSTCIVQPWRCIIRSQTVHINIYWHLQTFLSRPVMFFNAFGHKLCILESIDIHRHFPGILRCFSMHCVTNCAYLHLLTSTDIFLEAWDVFQASLQGVESSHQSHNGDQYTIAEVMSISFVRKCFPTRSHDMTTSPTGFFRMLRNIMFTLWRLFLRRWNKP